MGLFSFFKNQFIELIEWTDTSSQIIVYPIPFANRSIKMGATLTVRESQAAVIVNEGKVADVFSPGRYILSQENMPILNAQKSWKFGFKAPFRAEVYYVNTKQFTDINWTTVNPIIMKTPDFMDIRLNANGTYAFRVTSSEKFMKEIFGTNQIYDTTYINGQLKSILISGLSDLLNKTNIPVADLTSHHDEIGESTENKLQERFAAYGLELCSFIIENIILPEEVVAEIARAEEVMGTVDEAIVKELTVEEAVVVEAAVEEATVEVEFEEAKEEAPVEPVQIKCDECGHLVTANMKFCSNCGTGVKLERPCSCGYYMFSGVMKFCPNCGIKV